MFNQIGKIGDVRPNWSKWWFGENGPFGGPIVKIGSLGFNKNGD